ncbi:MAG TPA: DUF3373 domain-containing protein [Geobacteraceae bacterium]
MNTSMKKLAMGLFAGTLLMPLSSWGAEQDLQQKIDSLSKQVDELKQQVDQTKKKSLGQWLTIGGDYRFRYDYLQGDAVAYTQINPFFNPSQPVSATNPMAFAMPAQKFENSSLYTNRFGLDLKAKATENVSVTARLLMYKVSGAQDDAALRMTSIDPATGQVSQNAFFADRAGVFDGTLGHVPTDNKLLVDRVYATWNNIAEQPIWFSIGRRPSTGGIPSHLKQDKAAPGNSGVPALLVDYAFDGATLGYAPDIDALPGAYAKLCYGIGFENGLTNDSGNGLRDTHMIGVNIVPYDTDPFRAEFQWNRGVNIFDSPQILSGPGAALNSRPRAEVGDIDWYGLDFIGKLKNVGIGSLNWFVDAGLSVSHPNGKVNGLGQGLMFNAGQAVDDRTGWAVYVGGRYDIEPTATKIGFEYNHGSRDWITFSPAADDMWTSKVGTRGNVYEGYIIQELKLKPISSYLSKTFFKVGYQYYDFDYTGSNNWMGGAVRLADLSNPANAQFFTPLKNAQDVYATFEVHF